MPLLTLRGACLAFGHPPLVDHADFQIDAGERVALVGRNGSGKSSLLAAMAGRIALDDGELWRQPGTTIGLVPQEPTLDPERTVFDTVVAGMGDAAALIRGYHDVAHRLSTPGSDHDALLAQLHALQSELELRGAWTLHAQAQGAIDRFGLDPDAPVSTLSGGQKKRLALASAIASSPDLLLLDEPTNHLDLPAIEWLEEFLFARSGTLLFVTHDRRFLDRLATRIAELDRGRLASFPGRFDEYQARKERMLADEAVRAAKFDKVLAQEEVWIRKGIEARRTRNVGRVHRLERLREERAARRERTGRVGLKVDAGERSGALVAELEHVTKAWGEGDARRVVVRDFSARLVRGDKVGVIGPNGAGKTTLLRLILGEIAPDSGTIRRGTKLAVAYFDQFREQLDPEATLAGVIAPGSDFVEIGSERRHVIGYLGDFLFAPDRARSPVKSLSGGERNRLLLARLFARPANVLVLDEPTNDLDIETLELLEQLLQDYAGTLFLVSHDRAFLDAVVTQVIAAEGDGVWREHVGGYQDWAEWRARQRAAESADDRSATTGRAPTRTSDSATGASDSSADAGASAPASAPAAAPAPASRTSRPARLTWKEQRELEALPDRIAALEAEQATLTRRMEDASLYDDRDEARRVTERVAAIDGELTALLERWEALEAATRG